MVKKAPRTAPALMEAPLSRTPDLIKLEPALPWLSEQGSAGFVQALGRDRLLLQATPGSQGGSHLQRITVSLHEGPTFTLHGVCTPTAAEWVFVVDEKDQPRLLDMMGQLRKDQHIEICRSRDVEASDRFTGFDRLSFIPEALPLVDEADLNLSRGFLGRTFAAPLLITGMTGGIHKGAEINRRLAQAAARFNIPMGVGSQRIALDNPEYAAIFAVKPHAPGLFLIGNIGMSQLTGPDALSICQRAVEMINADALAIHFNLVQELVQVEGDRRFSGLFQGLERICRNLQVPVIAKEVGCGMTPQTIQRLLNMGFSAVDIGGKGGTSWSHIEGLRSRSEVSNDLGLSFRDWGIPTAYSLATVHQKFPKLPLIATGGIRDGLTVAKAIGLGANLVGIGLPLLRAALQDEEAPLAVLESLRQGLKLTMMATGATHLNELAPRLVLGRPLEQEFEAILRRP